MSVRQVLQDDISRPTCCCCVAGAQTPIQTAVFLRETGLSAAVGSTQGAEAGNKQVKQRYHHSSNKNRTSQTRNFRMQVARMELIVRRGRFLHNIERELSAQKVCDPRLRAPVCSKLN